ncbi:MAG: hypothetical protein K2X55_00525 [Burkholderiaceae bacterium]|nr:hypothetical protein [Burkholderiaceae bacterium]
MKPFICLLMLIGLVTSFASGIGNASGADLLKGVGYLAIFLICLPQVAKPEPAGRFAIAVKRASTPLMTLGIACMLAAFAWKNGWI